MFQAVAVSSIPTDCSGVFFVLVIELRLREIAHLALANWFSKGRNEHAGNVLRVPVSFTSPQICQYNFFNS